MNARRRPQESLRRRSSAALVASFDQLEPRLALAVSYGTTNDWGSGLQGELTLTNDTPATLANWQLSFNYSRDINSIWNAQIVSRTGSQYVIKGLDWNRTLAVGAAQGVGFIAGGGTSAPSNFVLAAVGSTPSPTPTLLPAPKPAVTLPKLSVTGAPVIEGVAGSSTTALFTVRLSKPSTHVVTVRYSTANGTATAGSDYTAASGTLTFTPGTTTQTIAVRILGDATVERNETLTLALSRPTKATVTGGRATATITNDDTASPPAAILPKVSIADVSGTEGNGDHAHFMFTAVLDKASITPVTVQYATSDGTATAGLDYTATTGTITFPAGVVSQLVHVGILGDPAVESAETVNVRLSNPAGATIADGLAVGTILDDDSALPPPAGAAQYVDITTFGSSNGSSHTGHDAFQGGRTAITTEALVAYNALRRFAGFAPSTLDEVGSWAFANSMTNNAQAWGNDIQGVGLYYAMQGAKVGWLADDKYDPQIVADIQRTARLGSPGDVMAMVAAYGHPGFAQYLIDNSSQTVFINTLKMEPHYGGWMHDRAHGRLVIEGAATAHDVNHLTILSHDQMRPFMNDTWDYPQWPALTVSKPRVIEYFQSMVTLGDPRGPLPIRG